MPQHPFHLLFFALGTPTALWGGGGDGLVLKASPGSGVTTGSGPREGCLRASGKFSQGVGLPLYAAWHSCDLL